jgi:hypothetical protein
MLYPSVLNPTPLTTGEYLIPGGNLICLRFTLSPLDAILINVAQTTNNQDFTLRAWVSSEVYGTEFNDIPKYLAIWSVNKAPSYENVIIYDQAIIKPADRSFAKPPGIFYLNILNVSNELNRCAVNLPSIFTAIPPPEPIPFTQ